MTDRVWWILSISALWCSTVSAATLSIGNVTINPGQTVIVPVTMASEGAAIAGVQFDLQWSPGISIEVASGDGIGQSYKSLYTSVQATRTLRCLIVGMNLNWLPDGSLVNLFINADSSAALQSIGLNLTNVIASDGTGEDVPIQAIPGGVQIVSGASQNFPAGAILNGASLLTGAVAPGEIVTVLGGFAVSSPAISFNGIPAPLIYASGSQINAIVPFELDVSGPAIFQVAGQNQAIVQQSLPVATVAPAIFTLGTSGTGAGAVLNQDFTVNTFSNPAPSNSFLMVYGTGFGPLQTTVADGQTVSAAIPLLLPVTATIGGLPATVSYAGSAPGLIAGVTQINVQVPEGLTPNPNAPLLLTVGAVTTPPGVTVSVR